MKRLKKIGLFLAAFLALAITASAQNASPPPNIGCDLSRGVLSKSGSYTLAPSDAGKLVQFTGSGSTASLPAVAPTTRWCAAIQNLNASALTISPNGLLYNTGSANLTIQQFDIVIVWTDGSNYFGRLPILSSGSVGLAYASNGMTISFTGSGTGTVQNSNTMVPGEGIFGGGTVSIYSSPGRLNCNATVFAGADDSLTIQNCLSAAKSINATAMDVDASGLTGNVWSANPEATPANMPGSGVLHLAAGTITTTVPFVDANRWSVAGQTVNSVIGQSGTTLQAAAGFPVAYSTGKVTVGVTAGANMTVTGNVSGGNATGWTTGVGGNIQIGCSFNTGGGANSTWGTILTINTSTQVLTLSFGVNNGTGASANSAYNIVCPLHLHGNGGTTGANFGSAAYNINFDANNLSGVIPEQNMFCQQGCFDENVETHNYNNIGFDFEGLIQNSGPWNHLISSPGTSCTANTLPFVWRTNGQNNFGVTNVSLGNGGCATTPNLGFDIEGDFAEVHNVDGEGVATSLALSSNPTCPFGCMLPPLAANGSVIDGIWNFNPIGTTLVHLSSAMGALTDVKVSNIQRGGNTVNSLLDDTNNCIDTDNRLMEYVINHNGQIELSTASIAQPDCQPNAPINGTTAQFSGPTPWIDITSPPYGAVADAKQTTTGSMTSGSPNLAITGTAPLFAAADATNTKLISVNMAPVQQPAQPTLTLNTSGGSTTCQAATNANNGFTIIAILITETNSVGEGQKSMERQIACNNNGTVNQVQVTPPAVLNGATTYSVYDCIGILFVCSGQELLDPNCTNVAIASTCTLNTISGATTAPPAPAVLVTTIKTFTDTLHVVLNANATQTVSNATVTWGTDNTTPITNALNACPGFVAGTTQRGCIVFVPPLGAYMVQNITTTKAGVHILGTCNQANIGTTDCASLWSSSTGYILTMGTSGSALNQGHTVEGIGFKDSSGTGNVSGGLRYLEMTHSLTKNVSCNYLTNVVHGSCVSFDSTGGDSQYNEIDGLYCIGATPFNCHKGVEFSDGQASNNWLHHLHIGGTQSGGDIGVDFMQNAGGTGANNSISDSSIETYNIDVHGGDTVHLIVGPHVNLENSNISGIGVGALIDTSGTNQCYNNTFIGMDFTNAGAAAVNGSGCVNTTVRASFRSAPSLRYFGTFGSIDDQAFSAAGGTHVTTQPLQNTVAQLQANTTAVVGDEQTVIDGLTNNDCRIGGGSYEVKCRSNGTTWDPVNPFGTLAASNVLAQSTSQSAVTLYTSPPVGSYDIHYNADLNTACSTGGNSVSFTFNWTDGTAARVGQTGSLSMAAGAPTNTAYLSGVFPAQVGSGNITYSSTISGSCATGTSKYDIHVWVTRAQ